MQVVELPRRRGTSIGLLLAGLPLVAIALVTMERMPWAATGLFLVIGVPLVVGATYGLVTKTPRFRASPEGVWFGGGRTIPWSDIGQVFESNTTVQVNRMPTTAQALSFELARKSALLRAPLRCWLAAPFSVGDIDVAAHDERAALLVAKIEALRPRA